MKKKRQSKSKLLLLLSIPILLIIPYIFIHESIHWLIFVLEPNANPIGFHILDSYSFNLNAGGCVVTEIKGKLIMPLATNEIVTTLLSTFIYFGITIYISLKLTNHKKRNPNA